MSILEEQIAVMQAFAAGKKIECIRRGSAQSWWEISRPIWNWAGYNYRVKKEKKTLWGMVKPLDKKDLIGRPDGQGAVGAIIWFNSKQELEAYYCTSTDKFHVVSVEIEV